MKKLISLLLMSLALVFCSCTQKLKEDISEEQTLSSLLGTRSEDPLNNTVWCLETGDTFDKFILFKDTKIKFFYGIFEDGEVHRYSDFYESDYTISKDERTIETDLVFPFYGEVCGVENLGVIKDSDLFLNLDNESYSFFGYYNKGLEEHWMLIFANIAPWN